MDDKVFKVRQTSGKKSPKQAPLATDSSAPAKPVSHAESGAATSHDMLYQGEFAILEAARVMSQRLSLKAPSLIFSLDEVGRGCLAGDVETGLSVWVHFTETDEFLTELVAAQDRVIAQVRDSKKLTDKARKRIFSELFSLSSPFSPKEISTSPESTTTPQPRDRILPAFAPSDTEEPRYFVQEQAVLHYGETSTLERPMSKFFAAGHTAPIPQGFHRHGGANGQSPSAALQSAPEDFVKQNPGQGQALVLLGLFVTRASAAEVDALGIWGATELAMTRAMLAGAERARSALGFDSLAEVAAITVALVDGDRELRFPAAFTPSFEAVVVKGDLRLKSIGAASIAAKEARDDLMVAMAEIYPGYGFEQHAAYGTKAHYEALKLLGPCPIHRRSFRLS